MPFDKLVGPVCPEAKLRKLVKNMLYPGVLAHLLGIDLEEMHKALFKQFGARKAKAAELNWGAVQAGDEYAREESRKADPFAVERMDQQSRQTDRRWQYGSRAGVRVRGRHRVDVVSHHAVLLAGRGIDRISQRAADRRRDRTRRPMPWCRPRMNSRRSAWRSAPVGPGRAP